VISTDKSVLLRMYCREIARFETPTFGEKVGELIARATSSPPRGCEAEHPGGLGVDDQLELGWASDVLRVATYLVGDGISKKGANCQNIPAPSPAGCVACKLPFACWASASFTRTCLGGRAGWAGFSKDDRAKGVTCLRARKSCSVRNAI
jgi:hypothetical protein